MFVSFLFLFHYLKRKQAKGVLKGADSQYGNIAVFRQYVMHAYALQGQCAARSDHSCDTSGYV